MRRLHEGGEDSTRGEPAIFATFVAAAAMHPDNSLRQRRYRQITINHFYRSSPTFEDPC